MEFHPKLMPPGKLTKNQAKNADKETAKVGNKLPNDKNKAENKNQGRNQQEKQAQPQRQQPRTAFEAPKTTQASQHVSQSGSHSGGQRPFTPRNPSTPFRQNFVSVRPPPVTPKQPPAVSQDILMDGTSRPDPSSPASPHFPKQLGRLVKLTEEQTPIEVLARIDTGADAHIAGKDLSGHAIPDGVHKSMFAVPLQRKKLAAECVKFVATTENGDILRVRAVHSPSTNTCLAPTAVSFDTSNPQPESDYAIIEGVKMPVHIIKGAPYVKLHLDPACIKSKKDFCYQMGLAEYPLPSDEDVAEFLHVKFACSGAHTLDLTCRI